MQKMNKQELEKQKIIEEYEFKNHTRSEQHTKNYKALSEALQPLVNENLEYLRYAIAKGLKLGLFKLKDNDSELAQEFSQYMKQEVTV